MAEEKSKCAGYVFGGEVREEEGVEGCRGGRHGDRVMIEIKSAGLEMKQAHLLALEVMDGRLPPPQLPPQAMQLLLTKKPLKNRPRTPVLRSDFGDEGDIIADADLPGPGSSEGSARHMAERDGLRSVMWKRVPVWTVRVGRRTTVVMVVRKLVKREDVEMKKTMVKRMAVTMTQKTTTPAPPLPQPSTHSTLLPFPVPSQLRSFTRLYTLKNRH